MNSTSVTISSRLISELPNGKVSDDFVFLYKRDFDFVVGIDPGASDGKTALAVWKRDKQKIMLVHRYNSVTELVVDIVHKLVSFPDKRFFIRVEDARLRKWFGSKKRQGKRGNDAKEYNAKRQGAGMIKAVCREIELALEMLSKQYKNLYFQMVHPVRRGTKWSAMQLEEAGVKVETPPPGDEPKPGKKKATVENQDVRDAIMLVYQFN